MKPVLNKKYFLYPIIVTILICVLITIYCVVNGDDMSMIMNDNSFFLAAGQIAAALLIAVILSVYKPTRNNGLWYIIPLILIAFALSYEFIIEITHPCC